MRTFETLTSALVLCGWLVVAAPVQAQDSVGVNAAIRKHLKPEMLSVFVAGDFAKAAGAPVAAPKK